MITDTHFVFLHAKGFQPFNAEFSPIGKPLQIGIRFTEELHFHLFKLSCSESEIAGCNLISERLTDLTYPKRNFLSGSTLHIFEIDKNSLCRFRSEVYRVFVIFRNTLKRLEHQVKLTDICKIMLTTGRTGNIVFFNKVLHLFLTPRIY